MPWNVVVPEDPTAVDGPKLSTIVFPSGTTADKRKNTASIQAQTATSLW